MMSDGMDIWAVRCPLQRAIFLVASGYKRLHTLHDRTVTEIGIHSAHTCAWYSGVGTRTDKALSWGGIGWLYPWEFLTAEFLRASAIGAKRVNGSYLASREQLARFLSWVFLVGFLT